MRKQRLFVRRYCVLLKLALLQEAERKIPTLSRAKLNIQNFFKRNSAQCVERLLQGSCHAAAGHLANGGSGPSLPSSEALRPGFCKGRYLRIADIGAVAASL